MAEDDVDPPLPSLAWRMGSTFIMGMAGGLTRMFMTLPNTTRSYGKDAFMDLLDDREDVEGRRRGLITVSNHVSVLDDPLIWGVLPYRYHLYPDNHRWSLGSHDIVFKNKIFSTFFSLGQTLPTHRLQHSPYGGLFQPTMTEAVRLLSHPPFNPPPTTRPSPPSLFENNEQPYLTDPFTSPTTPYTYTTNGHDTFPRPSAFAGRTYAWIHIFPEGKVHQHPLKTMRYFKWGVARLILEPDVCPDIVPMWIEGTETVMAEDRGWPRWAPRVGRRCGVWFGGNVGGVGGERYHDLRRRWRELVERDLREREARKGEGGGGAGRGVGELARGVLNERLKYGEEAVRLREEVTLQVRRDVLAVRRLRGLEDEDPKQGRVETWREEGGKEEGRMEDGSLVGGT